MCENIYITTTTVLAQQRTRVKDFFLAAISYYSFFPYSCSSTPCKSITKKENDKKKYIFPINYIRTQFMVFAFVLLLLVLSRIKFYATITTKHISFSPISLKYH